MKCKAVLLIGLLISSQRATAGDDEERSKNREALRQHFTTLFYNMRYLNSSHTNVDDDQLIVSTEKEAKSFLNQDEDWYLKAFMIRIRPKFGFSLPGMVSLSIVPETEIYWSK